MLRPLLGISQPDLERELLRKSVGMLRDGRVGCHDCGRTPLVGEQVHVYPRHVVLCELCRPRRRTPPERTVTVRSAERGHTVRARVRAAA
jgi:hypothetical protein